VSIVSSIKKRDSPFGGGGSGSGGGRTSSEDSWVQYPVGAVDFGWWVLFLGSGTAEEVSNFLMAGGVAPELFGLLVQSSGAMGPLGWLVWRWSREELFGWLM
jgi:hypothetical protein